jgi:hypothetical protein
MKAKDESGQDIGDLICFHVLHFIFCLSFSESLDAYI